MELKMMEVSRNLKKTMHSSRMRTARLLLVSPSLHCSRGVPAGGGGVPAWGAGVPGLGGVPGPRGCTWFGGCVYLVGGCTWSGGCTWPGGVPAWGVPAQGGVPAWGAHLPRYSPPCEQNDKQV